MGLRINPRVLKTTLKQLQGVRAVLLGLALELVSLQGVLIAAGKIAAGLACSFAGVVMAGLYVLLAPELVLFSWDEPEKAQDATTPP